MSTLKPGLYIVATPIGNLGDITLRALEVLRNVDVIFCEDTRKSSGLLTHYGISKPLYSCFEHNEHQRRHEIERRIQSGESVALISDAGTPLISDPGYSSVQSVYESGLYVSLLPGASSVIAALVLSGLPTDQFYFGGFFDVHKFESTAQFMGTLIFFESPRRLIKTLEALVTSRPLSVVREMTKIYESVVRGTVLEVLTHFKTHPDTLRGEIVLVFGKNIQVELGAWDVDLRKALGHYTLKEAVTLICESYQISKRDVYQKALSFLTLPGLYKSKENHCTEILSN